MKTKKLFLAFAVFASSCLTLSAQQVLISEDFSSDAWAAELLAQNPAYVKPAVGSNYTFPLATAYTCFGKYVITNQVIAVFDGLNATTNPTNKCALFDTQGIVHADVANLAVGFRFNNKGTAIFDFPEIASAGKMTIHVKNGNTTTATWLTLRKWVAETSTWDSIYAFPLSGSSVYLTNTIDEVVTYSIDSPNPIKLRLTGGNKNTSFFRVDVEEYVPNAIQSIKDLRFKIINRKVITEQPLSISVYSSTGNLLFQKQIKSEFEFPSSLKKGLYLVKSDFGTQKILLD